MHMTQGQYNVAGRFTNGPPGTRVEENWCNAVQDEIVNVIDEAGLVLKTAATETGDQLLEALRLLFVDQSELPGKNALGNASMRICQRGISGTGAAVYTAATTPNNDNRNITLDRWRVLGELCEDVVDVGQSLVAPAGFHYSMSFDVETINKKFGMMQIIESYDCQHMIGELVSLSFWAKVSSMAKLDNIQAVVCSWSGVDDIGAGVCTPDWVDTWENEDVFPVANALWTVENIPANLGVTEVWARYTIPSIFIDTALAKNIGVSIFSNGHCDTAGTMLYVTGVQLERTSVASNFEQISMQDDLARCQRYYQKSYDQDVKPGTATEAGSIESYTSADIANADYTMRVSVPLKVTMRRPPVVHPYDMAGAVDKCKMESGDGMVAAGTDGGTGAIKIEGNNGGSSSYSLLQFHYTADSEVGGANAF